MFPWYKDCFYVVDSCPLNKNQKALFAYSWAAVTDPAVRELKLGSVLILHVRSLDSDPAVFVSLSSTVTVCSTHNADHITQCAPSYPTEHMAVSSFIMSILNSSSIILHVSQEIFISWLFKHHLILSLIFSISLSANTLSLFSFEDQLLLNTWTRHLSLPLSAFMIPLFTLPCNLEKKEG